MERVMLLRRWKNLLNIGSNLPQVCYGIGFKMVNIYFLTMVISWEKDVEVFDSDIKLKKKKSTKIKKKSILQQTMTMTKIKNWKMWRVKKNSDNDETNVMSCFEN